MSSLSLCSSYRPPRMILFKLEVCFVFALHNLKISMHFLICSYLSAVSCETKISLIVYANFVLCYCPFIDFCLTTLRIICFPNSSKLVRYIEWFIYFTLLKTLLKFRLTFTEVNIYKRFCVFIFFAIRRQQHCQILPFMAAVVLSVDYRKPSNHITHKFVT